MARRSNRVDVDWATDVGDTFTWEQVQLEVLMDIRAELRRIRVRLDNTLGCHNFVGLPSTVNQLRDAIVPPAKAVTRRRLFRAEREWRRRGLVTPGKSGAIVDEILELFGQPPRKQ
jgi:hypothetical protein